MNPIPNENQLSPLSKLISEEVIAQLRMQGVQLARLPAGNGSQEHLNLAQSARMLGHSYFWLSRNYKQIGLRPSRIGGKLLFEQVEIRRLLEKRKIGFRGRPRPARLYDR